MSIWNIILLIVLVVVLVILIGLLMLVASLKREVQHQSLDSSVLMDEHFQNENRHIYGLSEQVSLLEKEMQGSIRRISNMSEQMEGIHQIMAHPKRRGSYGEIQLESLIENYLGANRSLFQRQYHLDNGKIADGVLFLSDDRLICIDSKFPLENWLAYQNYGDERNHREFLKNLKGHIDAIAQKYITDQTLPFALMFLPSEAIYHDLCANEDEMIGYSYQKRVLITSPTTLVGALSMLLYSSRDFYQAQNISEIQKSIKELESEMDQLEKDLEKAINHQQTLQKDLYAALNGVKRSKKSFDKATNADF